MGRFLTQDSYLGDVNLPPSLHRYLYAFNNPTAYVDPDGHFVWFAVAAYIAYSGANAAVDTAGEVALNETVNYATGQESTTTVKGTAQSFGVTLLGNVFTASAYGKVKNAKRIKNVAEKINKYRKIQKQPKTPAADVKINKEAKGNSTDVAESKPFKTSKKPEPKINPDLQKRKDALRDYKQSKGLSKTDKVSSEQFKNFKRANSGDAGKKLYDKKSQYKDHQVKKNGWAPSKTEKHHTIPREIQKKLPPEVADHKDVRGRSGLPNKKSIPYKKHRDIHQGAGGGKYNQRFEEEIEKIGGYQNVSPSELTKIRDKLVKEFGI